MIFDGQCLYVDKKLCSACAVEIPYIGYVQITDNRGIIRIRYQPQILQNLYPGKDFLQGILISKWENFQNKEVIQNISLTELENFQPSGWQFDGKKLEYIHSQLTANDIIGPNYQSGTLDNIRFDQYTEQKCTACKKKKTCLLFI